MKTLIFSYERYKIAEAELFETGTEIICNWNN